jgi:predicted anti-sigma-YlaC factor YlaD
MVKRSFVAAILLAAVFTASGCSLRAIAVNQLGNALASGGDVFASDDDPELVGDALPFSLKLIESLLAENPRHRGLLVAAARGFTQYSYGWVQRKADELEPVDPVAAATQRDRARRLYLRARNYGLRALSADAGFAQALSERPSETLTSLKRDDLDALYWTAASWGLLISSSKDQPDVVADLPLVGSMIDRAVELDESYGKGALHSFLISYEPNRPGGGADGLVRARRHFEWAVELSQGRLASPYVTLAEVVSVQTQNHAEFEEMLQRALAVDPDAVKEWRVENHLAQQRARWLLAHQQELFID